MKANFVVVLYGLLGVTSLTGYSTFFLKVAVLFGTKHQHKHKQGLGSLQRAA